MSNKLVYIAGQPFWMTPEGKFMTVEFSNGLPVENFIMKNN
ncbi:MAG: hypothetical protein RR272_02190 [Synergistaceae bacterium]